MARKPYWPGTLADQVSALQNFATKIAGYQTQLSWTAAQVTAAINLCTAFIVAYNFAEASRMTMQGATKWRDLVFYGGPTGGTIPSPPMFPIGELPAATRGVVTQFFALRDQIVAHSGYTLAMGEDLGIVGAEVSPLGPTDMTPQLKVSVSSGNTINVIGSMQGMDALRVEYQPNGGKFVTIAFLTKTPGGFQLTPTNPNQPENGMIRCVFIKKNAEFGNFSPNYPVTVS